MVKKLIKYDFASFMRLILPVQLILIGIAALSRFIQIFEDTKSSVYNIIFTSSIVLYVIAIVVALVLTAIVAIVRFYQGMYTNEGYLSHTLPVTSTQHILSKLIVSMLFELGSILAVFISFCVITLGELNIEIFKSAFFLLGKFYEAFGGHLIAYIAEFVLFILTSLVTVLLCWYFCISVGQLVSKKKVLLAFGVYFGLYVLSQIFNTFVIIFVTLNSELMEQITEWAMDNVIAFYHIALCTSLLITAIVGAVYFFITRYIMSKKLNLS